MKRMKLRRWHRTESNVVEGSQGGCHRRRDASKTALQLKLNVKLPTAPAASRLTQPPASSCLCEPSPWARNQQLAKNDCLNWQLIQFYKTLDPEQYDVLLPNATECQPS